MSNINQDDIESLSDQGSIYTFMRNVKIHTPGYGCEYTVRTSTIPLPTVIGTGWKTSGHTMTDIDHQECEDCAFPKGEMSVYRIAFGDPGRDKQGFERSIELCYLTAMKKIKANIKASQKIAFAPDHNDMFDEYSDAIRTLVQANRYQDICSPEQMMALLGVTQWYRLGRSSTYRLEDYIYKKSIEKVKYSLKMATLSVSGLMSKYLIMYPGVDTDYQRLYNMQKGLICRLFSEYMCNGSECLLWKDIKDLKTNFFKCLQHRAVSLHEAKTQELKSFLDPYVRMEEDKMVFGRPSLKDMHIMSLATQGRFLAFPPNSIKEKAVEKWKETALRKTRLPYSIVKEHMRYLHKYCTRNPDLEKIDWMVYSKFRAKPTASYDTSRDKCGKMEDYRRILSKLERVPVRCLQTFKILTYEGREWIEENPLQAYFSYALEVAIHQTYPKNETQVEYEPCVLEEARNATNLKRKGLLFPGEPGKFRTLTKGTTEAYVVAMPLAKALLCALAYDPRCTVGILGAEHAFYHRRKICENRLMYPQGVLRDDLKNSFLDLVAATDHSDRRLGVEIGREFANYLHLPEAYTDLVFELIEMPDIIEYGEETFIAENSLAMGDPVTKALLTLGQITSAEGARVILKENFNAKQLENHIEFDTRIENCEIDRLRFLSENVDSSVKVLSKDQIYNFNPYDVSATIDATLYEYLM